MLIVFSTQNIGKTVVHSNRGVVLNAKIPESKQINKFIVLITKIGSVWIGIPHLCKKAQDF